jgi:hypothetical protein
MEGGPERDGTIRVEASEPDSGRDVQADRDGQPADAGDGMADATPPTDATEEPEASVCLPESPDGTTGLFVAMGGSTSPSCGSLANPCASIDLALGVAATNATITTIYVGPGKFTEPATVALLDGIAIVGGWDILKTTWSHSCKAPEIDGPSPVFSATSLSSSTTLDTLDIVETAAAGPGGSVYGITSNASTLVLNDVSITVQPGGPGQDGTTGGPGEAGASGGCAPSAGGGVGSTGVNGNATSAGTFNPPPGGFTPASDGTLGATGGTGSNGTAGGYGAKATGKSSCVLDSYMTGCTAPTATFEGGTGVSGCPGFGGAGGTPATGGGCSVGLYVFGGSVTITGGTMKTGHGGAGGNGGVGGGGGTGAPGDVGTSVMYIGTCGFKSSPFPQCKATDLNADGGAAGGKGGSGGPGGQGGGGAGGCAYGYYAGSDASVTTTGASFSNGSGGVGGKPNGVTGPSANHN